MEGKAYNNPFFNIASLKQHEAKILKSWRTFWVWGIVILWESELALFNMWPQFFGLFPVLAFCIWKGKTDVFKN